QHVALWLVARECLGSAEHRDVGRKLAERAIAAAQRQTDQSQITSILYEQGRLSLGAGDRSAAERQWSELVDLTLVQPRLPRAKSSAGSVSTAKSDADRNGPIPATASQFAVAATISQAAAVNGLPELSLRAIREALSAGLPFPDPPVNSNDSLTA